MFPVHINIGSIFLPFYEGVYFAISIMLGLLIGIRVLEKNNKKESEYGAIIFGSILGAVMGGRLFHILFWDIGYYMANPLEIFAIWEGGISITGGIAGALIAAVVLCRRQKVVIWNYLAFLSPVILLAQGVGRIGCFLNGDAFGTPSNLPWAVAFRRYGTELFSMHTNTSVSSAVWGWCNKNGLVDMNSIWTVRMHPTQIYEALFDFALAALLFILMRRKVKDKIIGCLYIAGYSIFRFFIEYIRADREAVVLWNTSAIQFVLLAVGLIFLVGSIIEYRKESV